jgi:hypothetical protein
MQYVLNAVTLEKWLIYSVIFQYREYGNFAVNVLRTVVLGNN